MYQKLFMTEFLTHLDAASPARVGEPGQIVIDVDYPDNNTVQIWAYADWEPDAGVIECIVVDHLVGLELPYLLIR